MASTLADRRKLLIGGMSLLAGAGAPRVAPAQGAPDHAVFTEFSPNTKKMEAGWNRRIFTDTDTRKGTSIQCDLTSGIVTLAPGSYHISGFSTVAYDSGGEPAEMTTIRAPASAGYCRVRSVAAGASSAPLDLRAVDNADRSVLCIGSTASANMTPSLFETFYETGNAAHIVLEHQVGSKPEQIYLRVFAANSKWHAFARIAIRRL